MKIKKGGVPERGDIVLAKITRITPHAAFVTLEEYKDVEGIIHISEASKSWVKNLKTYFKEGQEVIAVVIDSKPHERFVHLSIRRLSKGDMKIKWEQIKRQKRAEAMLEILAKKLGKDFFDIYRAVKPLEEAFGELFAGFEEARIKGKSFLEKYIKDKKILEELYQLIEKSIPLPRVEISGVLTLKSYDGFGVDKIKEILGGIDAKVHYLGAPKYKITVEDMDYKAAEKKLNRILEKIRKHITSKEEFSFEREKR